MRKEEEQEDEEEGRGWGGGVCDRSALFKTITQHRRVEKIPPLPHFPGHLNSPGQRFWMGWCEAEISIFFCISPFPQAEIKKRTNYTSELE